MEQDIAQSDSQTSNQVQATAENLVPQQRLDEVTAARREAERQRDEYERKTLELNMKLAEQAALYQAQLAQASIRQPVVDHLAPLRERDPEMARIMEAQQKSQEDAYRRQLASLEAHTKSLELKLAVTAIPNAPPEVAAKAEQYLQRWLAAGVPATANDAVKFALGEHAEAQLRRVAGVQGVTPPPTPVLTQANSPVPPTQQATAKLPANFDRLPREQQDILLDQLYGDIPL